MILLQPQRKPADLAASILQFRSNWLVDASGNYSSYLKSPTGIATDPALTSHGVEQAHELATHLMSLDPPVDRVYSSPYYRCLQTVEPFLGLWARSASPDAASKPAILGEAGLSEWYGSAHFEHPTSASSDRLAELFPAFDRSYVPAVAPSRMGESIAQLHDRVALTMDALIKQCDAAGVRAVLLCSHAATVIALGRVLTGNMPENVEAEDFRAFTCGLSVFRRRPASRSVVAGEAAATSSPRTVGNLRTPTSQATASPDGYSNGLVDPSSTGVDWKDGKGVGGGWLCEVNGDCSFLSGGEERGW